MDSFRFGIMGAGNIANRFCDAVRRIGNDVSVVAVASKSKERAQSFAERNGIGRYYVGYGNMLETEQLDAVYVATTNNFHYSDCLLAISHGIPVLCEKPLMMSLNEAEEVFAAARLNNVFVMEGMWSRFIPCVQKAHEWIKAGRIGTVKIANYLGGINAPESHRIYVPELGGGAMYDLAVYPFEIVTYLVDQKLVGYESSIRWLNKEIDENDSFILRFEHCDATIQASLHTRIPSPSGFYGTKGFIQMSKTHMASEVRLFDEDFNLVESYAHPCENGFEWEILHVRDCVRAGMIESTIMPWCDTLLCAKVFDDCLRKENAGCS